MTVHSDQEAIKAVRFSAFKGDLAGVAAYLERGGDANIQVTDPKSMQTCDLLEDAVHGYDAREQFQFGEPAVRSAQEGQQVLIKMAKMLVASGFQISERNHVIAFSSHSVEPKEKLVAYLSATLRGKLTVPTQRSLRADGVPFDFEERQHALGNGHQHIQEESGYQMEPLVGRSNAKKSPATYGIALDTLDAQGRLKKASTIEKLPGL